MKNLLAILFLFIANSILGQSVGIGTETPHSSAILEVNSSDQGILIPRTDTASISTPAQGLMIYQNSDKSFYFYNGIKWNSFGPSSGGLADSDNDTKIIVESTPDDDQIRFISKDIEVMNHNGQALEMKNNGQSVFIGEFAGSTDDLSDNKNTFIGYKAGENNVSGTQNNAIGNQALNANVSGSNNIGIGQQSLFKSNGSNNVALGLNASKESTSGSKNIAIGNYSNFTNQTGIDNIAIGDEAGRGSGISSYSGNVFVGARSGKNVDTDGNVAIGRNALTNNTFGQNNIAIGDSAMFAGVPSNFSDFGSGNVAIGANAGKMNSNGRKNTFVGNNAGISNTSGSFSTATGYESGKSMTNASHNVMYGYKSGEKVTTGVSNVMMGSEAGVNSTTGESNIFLGRRAGYVNTTGNSNISIGEEAGLENRTGSDNIYLGHNSGRNVIAGSGNVYIGHESGKDNSGSNQLIISNDNNTKPLIEGRFDSLTTQINGQLAINNPDSTGYTMPEEDGGFGSVLRSDGDGNAYWFNAIGTTASGTVGISTVSEDDSSDDAENFKAVTSQSYKYFYDFPQIDGESNDASYIDLIVGYGLDYRYHNSTTSDCINIRMSIRKANDKASPKLLKNTYQNVVYDEVIIHQTISIDGNLVDIAKIKLKDVNITNIRHETYQRENSKYSSYEVIDLTFDEMTITYHEYDTTSTPTSTTEETIDCSITY